MATSAAYWIAAVVDKIYLQQSEIFILLLLLVFLFFLNSHRCSPAGCIDVKLDLPQEDTCPHLCQEEERFLKRPPEEIRNMILELFGE